MKRILILLSLITAHVSIFAQAVGPMTMKAASRVEAAAPAAGNCFEVSTTEQVCYSGVFPSDPIIVEAGQAVPLPATTYTNSSNSDMTFSIEWSGADFPGSGTIHTVTLPPQTNATFTDLQFVIPDTLGIGSHNIFIGWGADGGGFSASSTLPFELVVVMPGRLREIIQVPLRWCVVEGSPQAGAKNPGETVDGTKLLSLLQRVNNEVWLPNAGILYRPASAPQGIPVIKDPKVGEHKGDLAIGDNDEWHTGTALCETAWSERYPDQRGTPVVNARTVIPDSFVNVGGVASAEPFALRVASAQPGSGLRGDDLCGHPRHLMVFDVTWIQAAVVYDQSLFKAPGSRYTEDSLNPVKVLAHELGHTLSLGHGNGLDDNGDGLQPPTTGRRRFDEYCDSHAETEDTIPFSTCEASTSLMRNNTCTNLQPLQREMARESAKLVPGAVVTDPTADPAGSLLASLGACPPECPVAPSLVIWKAEMAQTPELATTNFSHGVLELLAASGSNRYSFFLDLDNDALTGCGIVEPGVPEFHGAELRTEVVLSVSGATVTVTSKVRRCDGGTWVEVQDPGIVASAFAQPNALEDSPTVSKYATVTIQMPDSVRGPAGSAVRVQAVAQGGGEVNLLPANGLGGVISLIPPQLPTCTTAPVVAHPGQTVTVAADGLPGGESAEIFVATSSVGTASVAAGGHLETTIVVPATSGSGVRQVEVRSQGGSVSAACALLVDGDRVTPATSISLSPAPNASDWNNSPVTVTLTAVDVPGGPGIQGVSYDATGAQPIPPTTQPGASAQFEINVEGHTSIHYFATSNSLATEAPQTATVHLDKTPPAIEFTGNHSPYGILDTVDITCTATDALSGVLLDTCQDVAGPAYIFDPANNVISATATDFAGNVGQNSTSFSLHVTYDDLCTLTQQFIESTRPMPPNARFLGNSFCQKLASAKAAQDRGNARAKSNQIAAYVAQVEANAHVAFSPEQVVILTRLAHAL